MLLLYKKYQTWDIVTYCIFCCSERNVGKSNSLKWSRFPLTPMRRYNDPMGRSGAHRTSTISSLTPCFSTSPTCRFHGGSESEHQPRMKCEILMKVDDWKEKGHGALQQLVPFRQIMKIPKDVKSVQIHSNPLKQFVPLTFPYQVYLLDPYLPINFHQIHLPSNFPSMFP
jgi:hypothetical protein